MSLVRKNVFITGASRGLGKYLARHFFDKGANVFLLSKNKESLHDALDGLSVRYMQKITYLDYDLGNQDSVSKLVDDISIFDIDVVINNAAIQGPIGPLSDNSWGEWQKTIQVNMLAPIAICRSLVPKLILKSSGSIINLSGGGATGPRANFTAYATAKAGLVRFSETLAEELKGTGVRVNCIAPGPMQTDMLREVVAAGAAQSGSKEFESANKILSQTNYSFKKVADLCEFLAIDKSKSISGKLISALWDPWENFDLLSGYLSNSDICTLRRITPEDRQTSWDNLR